MYCLTLASSGYSELLLPKSGEYHVFIAKFGSNSGLQKYQSIILTLNNMGSLCVHNTICIMCRQEYLYKHICIISYFPQLDIFPNKFKRAILCMA